MRALSIRQPYAELILRGIKRIEYRSRPTRMTGERFAIYVPLQPGDSAGFAQLGCSAEDLPTGVMVGSAVISHCSPPSGEGQFGDCWQWHLRGVRRYKRHRKPQRQPQPVWFQPFAA